MNRSNKGFGLTGVLVTVILLIVAAIFSASAKSSPLPEPTIYIVTSLSEQGIHHINS